MAALQVPSVVTRNANHLHDSDWRSLMEFFQQEGSAALMVLFCQKKLGIDPESLQKNIVEEEAELKKKQAELEKKKEALKKQTPVKK